MYLSLSLYIYIYMYTYTCYVTRFEAMWSQSQRLAVAVRNTHPSKSCKLSWLFISTLTHKTIHILQALLAFYFSVETQNHTHFAISLVTQTPSHTNIYIYIYIYIYTYNILRTVYIYIHIIRTIAIFWKLSRHTDSFTAYYYFYIMFHRSYYYCRHFIC